MTLDQIEAEEKKLQEERLKLQQKKKDILRKSIIACFQCKRWQFVCETHLVIDQEFRCPGQTGGYFVDSSRNFVCNHCKKESNFYNQPEMKTISEDLFASVERIDRSFVSYQTGE